MTWASVIRGSELLGKTKLRDIVGQPEQRVFMHMSIQTFRGSTFGLQNDATAQLSQTPNIKNCCLDCKFWIHIQQADMHGGLPKIATGTLEEDICRSNTNLLPSHSIQILALQFEENLQFALRNLFAIIIVTTHTNSYQSNISQRTDSNRINSCISVLNIWSHLLKKRSHLLHLCFQILLG